MNQNLILGANDRPKGGKWLLLSFQHVFAMFGATILVPLLTGLPVSVALFSSGVGTLIYIACTKRKVPIYLGSSFAYISYIIAASAMTGGTMGAAMTGIVIVGIIYCLVALMIKLLGVGWLNKLLPPIIIGPMIMVIGLGLSGTAINETGLLAPTAANLANNPWAGDYRAILTALFTMTFIAIIAIKAKGFLKVVPFLVGIASGYIFAVLISLIPNGSYPALINFAPVWASIKDPSLWFSLPKFVLLGWKEASLGAGITMTKINFSAAISVIPLAFVTICEHIGDHKVLGRITGEDYIANPGLHRTLLGDGLATSFAGLIGGPANTSYGENTSVVGITRIGSVWVTGGAAVIAIVISFVNVFAELISSIPLAVLGGVCLILYGFIAANGLKTMIDEKVDLTKTRNLIIVSVMLVIGIGGAILSFGNFSFSGMALSAIIGILLNSFLPHEKEDEEIKL
ncbi:MAG TPA: solute carrier family 23 protein [Bacilli bacterium]|nr:solute carrier family 23 protein [Bacilli bacterium]